MYDSDINKILHFPELPAKKYSNRDKITDIDKQNQAQQKKKTKEEILQDQTTGLLSKAFMEKEMSRLNTQRQLPISMIRLTIKNLEMISKVNGRKKCKEVILEITSKLQDTLRQEDLLARWSKSEFVVLLPQTPCQESIKIFARLQNKGKEDKNLTLPAPKVNILLAVNKSTKDNIYKLMTEPEKKMLVTFGENEDS